MKIFGIGFLFLLFLPLVAVWSGTKPAPHKCKADVCSCDFACDCGCGEGLPCRCGQKTVKTAAPPPRRAPHFKAVYAVVKVPGGFRLAWAGPLIRTEEEIGAQVETRRKALARKGILMEVWVPGPDAKEEHVELDFTPPPKAAPVEKVEPKKTERKKEDK